MAKGYWFAQVDITDANVYRRYQAANAEPFRKYGARFLVRGGSAEVVDASALTLAANHRDIRERGEVRRFDARPQIR